LDLNSQRLLPFREGIQESLLAKLLVPNI
jgi:hypothetical protein